MSFSRNSPAFPWCRSFLVAWWLKEAMWLCDGLKPIMRLLWGHIEAAGGHRHHNQISGVEWPVNELIYLYGWERHKIFPADGDASSGAVTSVLLGNAGR